MNEMAGIDPKADQPSVRRMTFFEHLEEVRQRLKVVAVVVLIFFILFLTTAVGSLTIGSARIPMLIPALGPNESPIANQFFLWLKSDLVPAQVAGRPVQFAFRALWEGVVVQIKTAFFLALMFSSPIVAYEVGQFVGPAMKPSEKRLLLRVTLPILVLFLAGLLLCFLVVLPFTFNLLYTYQTTLGADLLILWADDFISFTLLFMVAFGLSFELPVLMYGLSYLGVASSDFWKEHWRIAAIGIFLFGAIITPDGSGVTMMLVSIPMLGLYVIGYLFTVRLERKRGRTKSS